VNQHPLPVLLQAHSIGPDLQWLSANPP